MNTERPCPFCAAPTATSSCPACHRDLGAPRRVCQACQRVSPVAEAACCHCGAAARSEWRWKVPAIVAVLIFVVIVNALIIALQ